jgi:hypothetical protein
MSRIRTIKPEFFRHEELFEAEKSSGLPLRVAFPALWTVVDREGRFRWKPRILKLDCLPFDEVDFEDVLNALCRFGFIVKYRHGTETFGHIPKFVEHQVRNVREPASKLPAPDEYSSCTVPEHDEASRERERERERELEREGEGELRNARARANGAALLPPAVRSKDTYFEVWWKNWPHKIGKGAARPAFEKALKKTGIAILLGGIERYIAAKPRDRPWCNPATWLNQERWLDQECPVVQLGKSNGSAEATRRFLERNHGDYDLDGERSETSENRTGSVFPLLLPERQR